MVYINTIMIVIWATVLCGLWCGSHADIFSATTKLPPLLNTFKLVIADLDEYIQKEETRIFALKRKLELFKKEHAIAMEDMNEYVGNPINAFTLIKRLTMDLHDMVGDSNSTYELISDVTGNKGNAIFPDAEDLVGAATALTRLQDIYNLSVDELAEGKMYGVSYSLPMSADDCFGLGSILFYGNEYNDSINWMSKALQMYEGRGKTEVYSFTSAEVNKYIEWSLLRLENEEDDDDDDEQVARGEIYDTEGKPQTNSTYEDIMYLALCRDEYEPPPEITKRLTCFYLTKHHPFLRIAPFKAEQLYIDPDVYIFHDVMSDKEIVYLKFTAKPLFERAMVYTDGKGNHVDETRIGQYVFIEENSPLLRRISQRVTDFTGLSAQYSETLQVVNYGIGGQYGPHFDHTLKREQAGSPISGCLSGNRIATTLFYMSDVSAGGATVFPYLGLSVSPVKGAALFWMNLHPSGEGDLATLHAGCPVLRGSKWIATQWLHFNGQMFHRPCSLEYQDEDILRPLPAPVLKSTRIE